jgi:formylmethanofuran dehydrogenase subunit E
MIPLKKLFKLLITCMTCGDCGNAIHGTPAGYAGGQPLCGGCMRQRQ